MQHRDNNLNLLRLTAALLVLYAHSYAFFGNTPPAFIGITSYGELGIAIFFIISGYLIVQSWDATPSVKVFLIKRSLRIFPALIVVVLISTFVVGPFYSTLSLSEYFAHPTPFNYLKNIVLFPVFNLPGVLEHARVAHAVNGSLWSLPIEFFMYVLVVTLGVLFSAGRWIYTLATLIFLGLIILWCWQGAERLIIYGTDVRNLLQTGVYFMIGASYAKWRLERWFTLSAVCVLIMGTLLIAPHMTRPIALLWLALPLVVLAYGLSSSWLGSQVNRLGDCSYGVYIYAFPVQQFLLVSAPGLGYAEYLGLSIAITLCLGYLSWHLIEKKILKFKPQGMNA